MLLQEVLNKAVDWEWDESNSTPIHKFAKFSIDKNFYRVMFSIEPVDEFRPIELKGLESHTGKSRTDWGNAQSVEVSFDMSDVEGFRNAKDTMTGTGNEFLVMSTVIEITQKYMSTHNPAAVSFTGRGRSRVKVYERLMRVFKNKYTLVTRERMGDARKWIMIQNSLISEQQPVTEL